MKRSTSLGVIMQTPSRPARARGLKQVTCARCAASGKSRPARARGLKRPLLRHRPPGGGVAPRAGAWVETPSRSRPSLGGWSRPARARGLKHCLALYNAMAAESRPARARGLKLVGEECKACSKPVAPRAGAWVETLPAHVKHRSRSSRPARARGLKQLHVGAAVAKLVSRPARARGLKQREQDALLCQLGRAPRGRVG